MRIRSLDVGVEQIANWGAEHEVSLPRGERAAPAFLPRTRPLDEVLWRPSLDEKLPDLLQPHNLDAGLLRPAALSEARHDVQKIFSGMAARLPDEAGAVFAEVADFLLVDESRDEEIRSALAMLLRG